MDNKSIIIICVAILSSSLSAGPKKILVDPTKPSITPLISSTKKVKTKQIKQQELTAIFTKQGQRQAIINGQLYRKGDYVNGKRISRIHANNVLLTGSKGQSTLTLITLFKKPH